jgi:hypothetical protein
MENMYSKPQKYTDTIYIIDKKNFKSKLKNESMNCLTDLQVSVVDTNESVSLDYT